MNHFRFLGPNDSSQDFTLFGGGKAKNLSVLSKAGVPVPDWFCIPSTALDEFIDAHRISHQLAPGHENGANPRSIEDLFVSLPLPPRLSDALKSQLAALGWQNRDLAVRSSGIDEDSKDHSFAGQFSSYLFQKGEDAVFESIKRAWASAFSDRVRAYRRERGMQASRPGIGVVIQVMVKADAAGVLFTRNPFDPLDRDHLILDSVFGMGEGLVNGDLDSDHFKINRDSHEVILSRIAIKTHCYQRNDGGGLEKVELDQDLAKQPSLNPSLIRDLTEASLRLERLAGGIPQDIEWAVESGKISFLQMRPVTTLPDALFFDESVKGTSPTLWDNSNIIESYSGVTSPFTFSYASHAYHQVYRQFAVMMMVPDSIILEQDRRLKNMLGFIRGRIYYNLINWYQLLMIMPGSGNNPEFMETMMGVKKSLSLEHQKIFDFARNPPQYGFFFKVKLLVMSVFRFLRSDAIIADFKFHFNRVYREARTQNFRKWSLRQQIEYYQYLQNELLPRWKAPIVNDFLCMVFFGILKKLTQNWVLNGGEGASLQNDILCGQGDLESTEPTKMLMRIAESIDQGDANFREWFTRHSANEVWSGLNSGQNPFILSQFVDFLDRYGFRCVNELKFEERDLNDDPAFIVGTVSSYVKMKSYSVEKMAERERVIRESAEKTVRSKVSGLKSWIFFWVLKHTRKAVRNREDLRFDRTKSYGLVRQLMRAVGANLVSLGLIENEFDVFYLTVDEIISFVEGRMITHHTRSLIDLRKPVFEDYRKSVAPPDRFVTYGAVGPSMHYPSVLAAGDLLLNSEPVSTDPSLLFGTACSPGVVEGVVRVVHELKDTENLEGEILVTSRTDPGWVPLYPSCSGLLIERGSLLSHSAVVARELGLPTIVGISGGLMTRLKTGQRVRMDATKGEIRIL